MSEETQTEEVEGEGADEASESAVEEVENTVEEAVEGVEETVEEQREKVEERFEEVEEEVEERLEEGLDIVNDGVVDVVGAVLDTGARADVYVALRKIGEGDVDEIAEETGLYPGKVEETLEGLVEDEVVEEVKVGDDTVYTALAPTEVVTGLPGRLAERVRALVDSEGEDEGEENGRRVLSVNWSPYRLIIEPNETEEEEGEEIPVA